MPNAKITPFKPMANGMVFDARYFSGATEKNEAGVDYNAHSMYRFYANGNNAEAFAHQPRGVIACEPRRNVCARSGHDIVSQRVGGDEFADGNGEIGILPEPGAVRVQQLDGQSEHDGGEQITVAVELDFGNTTDENESCVAVVVEVDELRTGGSA